MKLSQLIQQLQSIASHLDTDLEVYQVAPFGVIPIGEVYYVDARLLRPDGTGPQQIYLHLRSRDLFMRKFDVC